MKNLIIISLIFLLLSCSKHNDLSNALYKDSNQPIEKRVQDLLSLMTLEEKVAQLTCYWIRPENTIIDSVGNLKYEKIDSFFNKGLGHIGCGDFQVHTTPKLSAITANNLQKYFKEKTRLGIPVILHEEGLHGHMSKDGTSFPIPIGLASTWNPELIEKIFSVTAAEIRSRGSHHAFTPVLDVARDPRWGRTEETYGEDPYLVSRMGLAAVRGFQGRKKMIDSIHVIATMKHFAAHGQPEAGTNIAPANYSERILREVFLYPFKVAVMEGNVKSVMASYNEIDGIPSHANKWLLQDILRKEWGFNGLVVSDYFAVKELHEIHKVAESRRQAAKVALETGVDIELPNPECYLNLVDLVNKGELDIKYIDAAVSRILNQKFELGLFDKPYVDINYAEQFVGNTEHRKLAKQAALEVITLLKNDQNILPLDQSKIKTLAVIGPNADLGLLGGYSGIPKHVITVKEGIINKVGGKIKEVYSEGYRINEDGTWWDDKIVIPAEDENNKRIKDALVVAKQADVIVLALGANEQISREAWASWHKGDKTSLDLVGKQEELFKELQKTNKPVIVLLLNGSPLSINYISQKAPAILECWYLGQEGGDAIADILFGDYNPGGKLAISIPRNTGQLPDFYNHKPSAKREYVFDTVAPLYPFGYGLSYTSFQFSEPRLSKDSIFINESVVVSLNVTNNGKYKGDEVVQLYIRDEYSSVTRPIKELKDFKRITLNPGETKTIEFEITPDKLSFYDIHMNYVVESGIFSIFTGNSSRWEDLKKVTLKVK